MKERNNESGELIIQIENINPLDFFGTHEKNLIILKKYFPQINITSRGNTIKLLGDFVTINIVESKIKMMIRHCEIYGALNEEDVVNFIEKDREDFSNEFPKEEIILYGKNGQVIKARTENQIKLVKASEENDVVFAIGPAGTGKTYTAVALAVRAFKNKQVKRIILTRPAVEAGENLGFLPGDMKEKLDPYMQPLYDALNDMFLPAKLAGLIEERAIEIAPLAFMRGRTLDNAFVILDEAQNATTPQLKMFLTRMGKNAKFIITGDITQIDLPSKINSGLVEAIEILQNVKGIEFVFLNEVDVVRHKLVVEILNAYKKVNK